MITVQLVFMITVVMTLLSVLSATPVFLLRLYLPENRGVAPTAVTVVNSAPAGVIIRATSGNHSKEYKGDSK